MKTCIVACKTIEDELLAAMNYCALAYPIHWIESGLHNTPKKLNFRLQNTLLEIDAERVLLVMGSCGNSIVGIHTGNYELIMPRVDDCISLLIGSVKKRTEISSKNAAYFLTEGWMKGERNLWVEYQYTVNKYGEDVANEIAASMYGHYKTLGILDAAVNPIEPLMESTKIIAETLHLKQIVVQASTAYIQELLLGPWTAERFVIKSPNSEFRTDDLLMKY